MPVEPSPYAVPETLDDPLVLYIVVRESLNMGAGKVAEVVGQGVGLLLGRYFGMRLTMNPVPFKRQLDDVPAFLAEGAKRDATKAWLETSYRLTVLIATDYEWEAIIATLPVFLVTDPVGSVAALVLWPVVTSQAPSIVKDLPALP